MRSLTLLTSVIVLCSTLTAAKHGPDQQQVLFSAPDRDASPSSLSSSTSPRKIAIIGSGPSGASAAYWLSKAQEKLDQLGRGQEGFDLHLYEREERIGGRTKVVFPFDDEERYQAVELGASIFADVNRNMQRAAKSFNLPTSAHLGEQDSLTGVWDGRQFVLDDLGGSWWSSARLFWRYGYSPVTTRTLVEELKNKFLRLYDPAFLHQIKSPNATQSGYPWPSIEKLAKHLNLSDAANADAQSWFYGKGVSQLFIQELIEAASRVNYGQNTDSIHALGAGVSLAASGAVGIRGGNHRVFQEMVARSNAKLHLGEHGEVTGLVKYDLKSLEQAFLAGQLSGVREEEVMTDSRSGGATKWWVGTAAGGGGLYDAVFIGTPWHAGGITLLNTEATIPVNKYVHLYVTLVVTNASHPDSEYFGRTKGSDVPKSILTTYEAVRKAGLAAKRKSKPTQGKRKKWYTMKQSTSTTSRVPELEFTSLTYLSKLPPRRDSKTVSAQDHLVKIFSLTPLSDEKLSELLGEGSLGWVYRQEWDAYPELHPTTVFPPIRPDDGLYYLNAMEPLISTMETSTVSSRNAVALALQEWLGLDFVIGSQCDFGAEAGARGDERTQDASEGWDGWGCHAG